MITAEIINIDTSYASNLVNLEGRMSEESIAKEPEDERESVLGQNDKETGSSTSDILEERRDARDKKFNYYLMSLVIFALSSIVLFTNLFDGLLRDFVEAFSFDSQGYHQLSIIVKVSSLFSLLFSGFYVFRQYLLGENDFFDIFGAGLFRRLRPSGSEKPGASKPYSQRKIADIEDRVYSLEAGFTKTIEEYREEFQGVIEAQLSNIETEKLFIRLKAELENKNEYNELLSSLEYMTENLKSYEESNRRQLTINLAIGAIGTIGAIAVASTLVFGVDAQLDALNTTSALLKHYLPWASLVFVIQLMSLFFLRLYRDNIKTERYLRNEITNIASKRTAIFLAYHTNSPALIKSVMMEMASVERNRFLEKGQSTVELESARIEVAGFKDGVEAMSGVVPWSKRNTASPRKARAPKKKPPKAAGTP